jgi:hypothetical protein
MKDWAFVHVCVESLRMMVCVRSWSLAPYSCLSLPSICSLRFPRESNLLPSSVVMVGNCPYLVESRSARKLVQIYSFRCVSAQFLV